MKLYFHYCPQGFSNCYVLGTDFPQEDEYVNGEASAPREAILIDPGIMDEKVLRLIEDHDYTLKGVLVTHDHPHHVLGLRTLRRIYNVSVYAINPYVKGIRTTIVHDGDTLDIGPFKIEVISIPGHSTDSCVYKIGRLLFSGDVLSAGLLGSTASFYGQSTQVHAVRSRLLSLPGDYTVLPGHGPPSTLEAERRFNTDLNSFDKIKQSRSAFKIEFFQ